MINNKMYYCYGWRDPNTEEKRWLKINLVQMKGL